jgi:hypothetical protein
MAQEIAREHHQVLHRTHHHLHILIKIKKSNQVFKKRTKFYQSGKTEVFNFGRTDNALAEEDDCSTSSFDIDDDNDTYDEYDEQELLMEFKKLISKHMKLQKRHGDLLCFHKELLDSYALLESAHEVMVTKVKDSQPHTCTCAPPSIDISCAKSFCS